MHRRFAFFFLAMTSLSAEPVVVRHMEGTEHGFLVLRNEAGKPIGSGDLVQVTTGYRVNSHLTFRFHDGSIDDERSVFNQDKIFLLVHDRHIQKGPSFPEPIDMTIDRPTGTVTVRSVKKGKQELHTEHLDLPEDLANGSLLTVLKNISPETAETKVSFLVGDPKPRLIKFAIVPEGKDKFTVVGSRQTAMRFGVRAELGGIAGIIAPLIGKQPPETQVWIAGGEAPAFVKMQGILYLGGPIWTIELSSPVW